MISKHSVNVMCNVTAERGAPDQCSSPDRFHRYTGSGFKDNVSDVVQPENLAASENQTSMEKYLDSLNLSAVGKARFLEGLQSHAGNRLHSTALDEDLNSLEDQCPNKSTAERIHGRGGAVKRPQRNEATSCQKSTAGIDKKKPKKTQMDEGKATAELEEPQTSSALQEAQQQQSKSPSQRVNSGRKKRTSYSQTSGLRSLRTRKKQRAKEPGAAKSKKPQTQAWLSKQDHKGDSDTGADPKKRIYTSEVEDGPSEISAAQKARMSTLNTGPLTDRSSPVKNAKAVGSSSERTSNDRQRRERRGAWQRPELQLVLDAFVDYIDHYRESVDSKVVKKSVNAFASVVKEQLEEKISLSKELKVLQKSNAKVRSSGQTTTRRLLDKKYELMRAERQIFLLHKEKGQRELRLSDLRTGQVFLHDLSELNRQYLDDRRKNSEENEMYGASALPALVQEINHLHSTEAQLRCINSQL